MAGVRCELESPDAAVLARAATVFRAHVSAVLVEREAPADIRWRIEAAPPPNQVNGSSGADPDSAAVRRWRIQRRGAEGQDITRGSVDAALRSIEFGSVLAVTEGDYGLVTLHAALLARNGQGLLVLGPCESGKSTLSAALWRDGWSLLGDDVTAVDHRGRALPVPRRVSLRHGSRDLLGDALWSRILAAPSCSPTSEGCLFHPSDVDGMPSPSSTPLTAVVFLARRGTALGSLEVARINAAQALLSLAPYSNVVHRSGMAEALERLQPLAASTPAFDLGRGPLDGMLNAIEREIVGVRVGARV